MMKILNRYIAKTIVAATAMTALIIIGVLFLMTMLGELKNIGQGDYGINQVFIYVLLRMPSLIYQFSPLLILLGCIVGLSMLTSHQELTVMRSSGFASRRIIFSVLSSALLMILVISIAGEWLGPGLSYKAEVRKENAKNAGQAVVTAAGDWFHIDNNFIHIQRVVDRQLLEGVTRYEFDDKHHLQVAYYANTLSFQDHQWKMHNVVKTTFYHERTKSQAYQETPWDLQLNANLLKVGVVDPHEMSLPRLANFARYLKQNGLQASEYEFDFWQRLFQPFASLVMIFLAIPFVLGTLRTSTMGWRIVVGIMIGFAFFILNAFFGQLCVVYQIPPLISALLPTIIFAVFGVVLSNRMIRY